MEHDEETITTIYAFLSNPSEAFSKPHVSTVKPKGNIKFWSDFDKHFTEASKKIKFTVNSDTTKLLEDLNPKNIAKEIHAKISETFNKILEDILVAFLDSLIVLFDGIEDLEVLAHDIYEKLRSIPVLHKILPPLRWKYTLPPDSGFYNWGLSIENHPKEIKVLKTAQDIHDFIVKVNGEESPKIRVGAFTHSSSPLFGDDKITHYGALLTDKQTAVDPNPEIIKFTPDLSRAYVEGSPLMFVESAGNDRIRVGGATPNGVYYHWAQKRLENNLPYPSEPCNTLQFDQSFPGTHAVGCHGSGKTSKSLSDYITKLKIINFEGKEVNYEGDDLKIMATHLGLFGVVTEMELQYEKQYFVEYTPKNVKVDNYLSPNNTEFQNDVATHFYHEMFWSPLTETIFVNKWNKTDVAKEWKNFPDKVTGAAQILEETMFQLINQLAPEIKTRGWLGFIWTKIVGYFSAKALEIPKGGQIIIPSQQAIHFRRGVQRMRCLLMEWSFPLKSIDVKVKNQNGEYETKSAPDVTLLRELMLDAINLVKEYESKSEYPQLLPLETRIIQNSDTLLSPAYGNEYTAFIEVLTGIGGPKSTNLYNRYCNELTAQWAKTAAKHGVYNIKPHWGKLWQMLDNIPYYTAPDKSTPLDIYTYLRTQYKDQIPIFNQLRQKADPNNVFMNEALGKIFLPIQPKEEHEEKVDI